MNNRPYIKATPQTGPWIIKDSTGSWIIQDSKIIAAIAGLIAVGASYGAYHWWTYKPGKSGKKSISDDQTKIRGSTEADESIKKVTLSQYPFAAIGGHAKPSTGGITQLSLDKDASASVQNTAEKKLDSSVSPTRRRTS